MILHRSFSPEAGRPKKLALFDIDGTIFPDKPDEFTGTAYWHMRRNNLLNDGSEEEIETLESLRQQYAFSDDLSTRRLYFNPMNKAFDKQIATRSRADVDRIADDIIEERMNEAYSAIVERLQAHQDNGEYIGFISGSPNFLIQSLKRALGADIATGTRFYSSGGGVYHPSRRPSPRGSNKDVIAENMLIDLSQRRLQTLGRGTLATATHRQASLDIFDQEDRFVLERGYGDSEGDLSMLQKAREPVAVQPKPELRVVAERHEWTIIDQVQTHPITKERGSHE